MKINFEKNERLSYFKRWGLYAFLAVLLSILDIVLMDFISINGLNPDFLLILVVWIALSEGQFYALFAGFVCGLIYDLVSFDVIGTNALAKTLVALIAGWFYNENKININIGGYRFLIIVFITSVAHNLVYYFLYIKFSEISFFPFFIRYGLAISFYTTIIAIFPMLLKIPKNKLIR